MITGVILAGGQGRRMGGRMKALLPIGDVPILSIQLREMAKLCKRVLIVTSAQDQLRPYLTGEADVEVRMIEDLYGQTGPLGGIHAASSALDDGLMWVTGCDMPFLSAAAARAMCSKFSLEAGCDAVVPVLGGRTHPLHGIYAAHIGRSAENLLKAGEYRLMSLLDRIRWQAADDAFFLERGIPLNFAVNLNTPEDYEAAVRLSSNQAGF